MTVGRLVAVALLAVACSEPKAAPPPSSFLLGGIQVNEPDMEQWLDTLKESGLNTVSLTTYARQARWDSSELSSDSKVEWLVPEIRAAKSRGLRVVLILRVALEHALEENLFLWHGMIMPKSDEQLAGWFSDYSDFVLRWARIAQSEGVDVLGIGSELNALVSTVPVLQLPELEEFYLNADKQQAAQERVLTYDDEIEPGQLKAGWGKTYDSLPSYLSAQSSALRRWAEQVTFGADLTAINARRRLLEAAWRDLIAAVRQVYAGRLTYAANFDQYQAVGFWDALDVIGVNAYFPLRDTVGEIADPEELYPIFEASWTEIFDQLRRYRETAEVSDKPIIFTELGYTFRSGSTVGPWAGSGFNVVGGWNEGDDGELMVWQQRPVDYWERALAVRALRVVAARSADEFLQGLLYWKLSTQASHREIEPFVLILGPGPDDPLLSELRLFLSSG